MIEWEWHFSEFNIYRNEDKIPCLQTAKNTIRIFRNIPDGTHTHAHTQINANILLTFQLKMDTNTFQRKRLYVCFYIDFSLCFSLSHRHRNKHSGIIIDWNVLECDSFGTHLMWVREQPRRRKRIIWWLFYLYSLLAYFNRPKNARAFSSEVCNLLAQYWKW